MRTCAFVLAGWIGCAATGASQDLVRSDDPAGTAMVAAPSVVSTTSVEPPRGSYAPITTGERVFWIVDGTIGRKSLGVGVFTSAWQTAWNQPEEWGNTWSGFGKRYLEREADVAMSNTIEAGLGAIWGEDPRYIPAPRGSIRSRIGYAFKTVVLAPRRDGHLAPAWGRYAGNTFNNLIENTYMPPSYTTPGQTVLRSVSGLASRLVYNVWEEFWPDIRARLHH